MRLQEAEERANPELAVARETATFLRCELAGAERLLRLALHCANPAALPKTVREALENERAAQTAWFAAMDKVRALEAKAP